MKLTGFIGHFCMAFLVQMKSRLYAPLITLFSPYFIQFSHRNLRCDRSIFSNHRWVNRQVYWKTGKISALLRGFLRLFISTRFPQVLLCIAQEPLHLFFHVLRKMGRFVGGEEGIFGFDAALYHFWMAKIGPSFKVMPVEERGKPEFVAEIHGGVYFGEVIAAGADGVDDVEAKFVVVDRDAARKPFDIADEFMLEHEDGEGTALVHAADAEVAEDVRTGQHTDGEG